jgi:hypothetical protein
MIVQLELDPEMEARIVSEARARGIASNLYAGASYESAGITL